MPILLGAVTGSAPQAQPLMVGFGLGGAGGARPSPDGLVLQPTSVTLLVACFIGGLELFRRGHDSPSVQAGLLSLLKGQ